MAGPGWSALGAQEALALFLIVSLVLHILFFVSDPQYRRFQLAAIRDVVGKVSEIAVCGVAWLPQWTQTRFGCLRPLRSMAARTQPNKVSVCVAIPCRLAHWALLPRALRSISLQTRRADHVLVLLSHVSLDACGTLQCELKAWLPGAELSCDLAENVTHTRGANRNRGGVLCAQRNASHVAFLDADDEMYPSRLERMLSLMREYDADLGLHSYVVQSPTSSLKVQAWDKNGDKGAEARIRGPNEVRAGVRAGVRAAVTRQNSPPLLPFDTHHGHVVVRLSTLAAVPQRKDMRTGQDARFVFDVVKAGYRTVHTSERLTVYHQGASIGGQTDDRVDVFTTPRWLRFWDFHNRTWRKLRVGGGGGGCNANASAAPGRGGTGRGGRGVTLTGRRSVTRAPNARAKPHFNATCRSKRSCIHVHKGFGRPELRGYHAPRTPNLLG